MGDAPPRLPCRFGMPVGKFTISTAPGPIQIDDMRSYVTLRAGGYFFLPSRAALQFMIGASS